MDGTGDRAAGSVLDLLRPDTSPIRLLYRDQELARLVRWLTARGWRQSRVMVLGGPAGAGKSRLALEAARASGRQPLILVEDADLRTDLADLLSEVLASRPDRSVLPEVRVLLVARSAMGFARSVVSRAQPVLPSAESLEVLELAWELSPAQGKGVFREALAGYAELLSVQSASLSALARGHEAGTGTRGTTGPFGLIVARALLTALYARHGGPLPGNVLRLSVTKVAEGLIRAERHWWTAATEWDWGAADPPSQALRDRAIAAVTLLGARSEDEVADVLRLVPGLAEATASRRRAVASWITALYPAGNGLPVSLASEWFVVRQLTASPSLAGALRSEITAGQQARALGMLARAAGWVRGAEQLFGTFADGDADRQACALTHASMGESWAATRLDAILARQLRSVGGLRHSQWLPGEEESRAGELVQLARIDAAADGYRQLPATRCAVAANRTARYRALAARSAVYWPGLAHELRLVGSAEARREGDAIWYALDRKVEGFPAELGYLLGRPGTAETAATVIRAWRCTWTSGTQAYLYRLRRMPSTLHAEGLDEEALEAAREVVLIERASRDASSFLTGAATERGAPSYALGLALSDLAGALDRLGRYQESVLATRELAGIWRAEGPQLGDAGIAALPEALLDLSIRLGKAGLSAEASEARAEMLRLARERLTRGASITYDWPDSGLICPTWALRDPEARVLAELAWDEAAARGLELLHPDGRVDVRGLIQGFGAFWREHGDLPGKDGRYPRVAPDRVLLSLLRRAVGEDGSVEPHSCGVSVRRMRRRVLHARINIVLRRQYTDVSGEPADQCAAIQLHELAPERERRWYRGNPLPTALGDVDWLLAEQGLDCGVLVLVNRRAARRPPRLAKAPPAYPDPRISETRTRNDRDVMVLTC